jgi:hypothetical protein
MAVEEMASLQLTGLPPGEIFSVDCSESHTGSTTGVV